MNDIEETVVSEKKFARVRKVTKLLAVGTVIGAAATAAFAATKAKSNSN